MKNALQHFKQNKPTFDIWIKTRQYLQLSNDIIKPLVQPFKDENPLSNLSESCPDCIIDMLIWYNIQLKKENKPEAETTNNTKPTKKKNDNNNNTNNSTKQNQ